MKSGRSGIVRVDDEGLEKLGFGKEVDLDCLRVKEGSRREWREICCFGNFFFFFFNQNY